MELARPQIAVMLSGLGTDSKRLLSEAMERFGLGLRHYGLLKSLAYSPVFSQQQLAHKLRIDRANLVEVIDELEERHLVERVPDPVDRRRHTLRITAAGRKTWNQMERAAADADATLLAGLPESEHEVLRASLLKLMRCRWQMVEPEEGQSRSA